MKLAVRYGKGAESKNFKLGEGLVGWAAQHKEPVLVSDVSQDPRYINLVADARSELVIPMLIKDRCIGVFDLESPELDAFTQRASGTADAPGEPGGRRDRQRAALRGGSAKRGADREGASFRATCPDSVVARRSRPRQSATPTWRVGSSRRTSWEGTSTTSSRPNRTRLSWQWATFQERARPQRCTARLPPNSFVPARCAGGLRPIASASSGVLQAMNTTLHERQLEEYYCTSVLRLLRFLTTGRHAFELGAPVSDSLHGELVRTNRAARCAAGIVSGGYLRRGEHRSAHEATSSCSALTEFSRRSTKTGVEFGATRLADVVSRHREQSARAIVDAIFEETVGVSRRPPQADDMTAVAVKITA